MACARFKIATKAPQDRFSKGVYFIVGLTHSAIG